VAGSSLALVAVLAATGCAARPPLVDLRYAREFLDGPCRADGDEAFLRAWRAHAERHAGAYAELYGSAAGDPALTRGEACKRVRTTTVCVPALVAELRPRVAALVGALPGDPVVVTVPLAGDDGGMRQLDGRAVVALDATHETYTRSTAMLVTIAHELVHSAQRARFGARIDALPPAARSLYAEGTAVYAMTVLFPEVGDRATGLDAETVARVRAARAAEAAELLALLDGGDARGWFGGGAHPRFGPKPGYVLGLDTLRALAARRGVEAALRLSPEEFLVEARRELAAGAAP
jgi:hypothetical protein